MNVLDLFSGIGGFSLGLERAGMRTVAFCEIEEYPRAVLTERWPGVPIYGDIRELNAKRLGADGISVDLICGGFPCQDISVAGRRAGIEGERSGLWSEYARLIGELRPRYVIVENVAALLGRGLERVLGDLAAIGYDAEWHCIPASYVGAPHLRDRIWIVAYPAGPDAGGDAKQPEGQEPTNRESAQLLSNASRGSGADRAWPDNAEPLADADSRHVNRGRRPLQMGWGRLAQEAAADGELGRTQWSVEPDVGRVADGTPYGAYRLRALGGSLVPQISEIIGSALMAHHRGTGGNK